MNRTHLKLLPLLCLSVLLLTANIALATPPEDTETDTETMEIKVDLQRDADLLKKEKLAEEALKKAKTEIQNKPASEDSQEQAKGPDYDISKAVQRALAANPDIAAAKASALGYEAARKSALADFFPVFTVGYQWKGYDHVKPNRGVPSALQTPANQWALTVNASQTVFDGGALIFSFQKARLAKRKSETDLANAELSLIQNVQSNFLQLLKYRENVRSAEDSVTRLTSQLKVTQAFHDVGLKPKLDVLQAEVDLANAEDGLLQAQNAVSTQEAQLNTLLDISLYDDVNYTGELEYLPFTLNLEECMKNAYRNRPDVKSMRSAVQMSEKDANIARSALFPQISAGYDWSSTGNHPNVYGTPNQRTEYSEWSVGMAASWKVFDFGSTLYDWRQAQQGVRQYMAQEDSLRLNVGYEVKSRYLKINETAERISVARKGVDAAKEGYRMALARYQAQVGTNTDVLDAQEKLTQAEASLTSALADYQEAMANMYIAMGMKNFSLVPN